MCSGMLFRHQNCAYNPASTTRNSGCSCMLSKQLQNYNTWYSRVKRWTEDPDEISQNVLINGWYGLIGSWVFSSCSYENSKFLAIGMYDLHDQKKRKKHLWPLVNFSYKNLKDNLGNVP